MTFWSKCLGPVLLLATALLPIRASAADLNFSLVGHMADTTTKLWWDVVLEQRLRLVDAATGQSLPQMTVSVGDRITGSLVLDSPMTIAAGLGLDVWVRFGLFSPLESDFVYGDVQLTVLNHGAPVTLPDGFEKFLAGPGSLGVGGFSPDGPPSTALTFDEIRFSQVVTSLLTYGAPVQSVLLRPDSAVLSALLTVPEPDQGVLLMSGLGLFWWAHRRSARQSRTE